MLQAIPLEEPAADSVDPNADATSESPVILSELEAVISGTLCPPERRCDISRIESKDLRMSPSARTQPPPHSAPKLAPPPSSLPSKSKPPQPPTDLATLSDHLSLLRRWYYRPEKQRAGEVFFPEKRRRPKLAHPPHPQRRRPHGPRRPQTPRRNPTRAAQRNTATRNPR